MRPEDAIRWFDASPNAYMVLDRQLRYVAANPSYLAVTASRWEDICGRVIFDLFPNEPDDPANEPRRLLEGSLRRVLRTGERDVLAYIPYRVAREPGAEPELRIWSATHIPLLDADGQVEAVLQHTEDVTELHRDSTSASKMLGRAEEVQREYRQLGAFIEALDQAPGFIAFVRGPEFVFGFCNRAYERLVGGRRVVGRLVREVLPDIADQGFFELLEQVYRTGDPFVGRNMRVTLEQSSGQHHSAWVDFVYQPILGPDGAPSGILIQGQEVTELVRARNRDRFRARSSELIARAGDDAEAALCGVAAAAVETIADWAIVDLFEDTGSRRIAVAHADPERSADAQALRAYPIPQPLPEGHPLSGLDQGPVLVRSMPDELLVRGATGDRHLDVVRRLAPASMVGVPLRHRDRLYGALILLTADSRRYDDDDLRAMVELGQVISTALDNARLSLERLALLRAAEEALEQAESANRSKDEFLAMLGHEMRNPLAPILTAVDLLRGDPDAPVERVLQIIERQARHLTRLVDDMLDVSRIVHGKLELRQAPVAVSVCVTKAVEIATGAITTKEHTLTVAPVPEDAVVFGDEARIAQVVANLLVNAARYTPPRGHVDLHTELQGDAVVIRVRDDGIGIEPDMLPRIFELFVQAPQRSDRADGGLGLGLSLVKKLVEMHGGHVSAKSDGPGQGSEIRVVLPRYVADGDRHDSGPHPPTSGGARDIVVVDDNADAAEMLALVLGGAQHRVEVCTDGHEALDHILANPPDLAIVDLGLPGLDGFELAMRLREQLGPATPPLIALTGYGGTEERARTANAGFSAHLTKPADTARLLALITSLTA